MSDTHAIRLAHTIRFDTRIGDNTLRYVHDTCRYTRGDTVLSRGKTVPKPVRGAPQGTPRTLGKVVLQRGTVTKCTRAANTRYCLCCIGVVTGAPVGHLAREIARAAFYVMLCYDF